MKKMSNITQKDAKKIVEGVKLSIATAKRNKQYDLVKQGQELLDNMPEEIRQLLKGGH
jgi:hypothetical protein